MKKKVFSTNPSYVSFIENAEIVDLIKDSDIVLFHGGEDVSPELYGENKHSFTHSNTQRDKTDIHLFKKAVELNKLIIGVCRGSQLSCVMAGGKLVQHVNNHGLAGTHKMKTYDNKELDVTSTHHQMMYPFDVPHKILGWSENLSDVYFKNDINVYTDIKREPEIVFFPEIKALGIQPHPEYMDKDCKFVKWINKLINSL